MIEKLEYKLLENKKVIEIFEKYFGYTYMHFRNECKILKCKDIDDIVIKIALDLQYEFMFFNELINKRIK